MANDFNLGMDEDNISEYLEVVSEELINEELLDLEQECTAENRQEKKKLLGRKTTPKETHNEGLSRYFCRPQRAP